MPKLSSSHLLRPTSAHRSTYWPWLAAVVILGVSQSLLAATPYSGEVTLKLDRALFKIDSTGKEAAPSLDLNLVCVDGQWRPEVWGRGPTFNRADHEGRVVAQSVAGDALKIEIQMLIGGDAWVPGGAAIYKVSLRPDGDAMKGTFEGSFRARPVKGEIIGQRLPLRLPPAGFKPVEPGEHPRLLFRKADLAALKAKAQTPFGQTIVGRLKEAKDDTWCLGMLYQLTGDRQYAQQAQAIVAKYIKGQPQTGDKGSGAHDVSQVGMAFDLCYDGWDEGFRQQVRQWLLGGQNAVERWILRPQNLAPKMNQSDGSNWNANIRGNVFPAALAMVGEPSAIPVEPVKPGTVITLESPAGFAAGKGVPVENLVPGKAPKQWLMAGPWTVEKGQSPDCLASVGGCEKARPEEGTEVDYNGTKLTFALLDAKWSGDGINIEKMLAGKTAFSAYFYSVIDNPELRVMQFKVGHGPSAVYVGGQRVYEGDYYQLGKGRFPVMVRTTMGDNAWGQVRPTFVTVTDEQIQADLAGRMAVYNVAHRIWEDDKALWEKTHENVWARKLATMISRIMGRYNRASLGDGGWNSEGEAYTLWSIGNPLTAAHMYKSVNGIDISPQMNVGMFPCKYVAETVWDNTGTRKRARKLCFGGGAGTAGPEHYALSIGLVPEQYKPYVLWAWDKADDLGKEQPLGEQPKNDDFDGPAVPGGRAAIFTFLNYPLDLKAKSPEDGFPKVYVDHQKGGYIFRNAFKGNDDIVAELAGNEDSAVGWNFDNAGSFQLQGLGREWVVQSGYTKYDGNRIAQNVVVLPQAPSQGGHGQRTFFDGQKDGSGSVTLNLDEIYLGRESYKIPLKDDLGHLIPGNYQDLGIRASRSFAVDYSGKAGVPALIVIVDKFSKEGGEKVWQAAIPKEATVVTGGNTFTIVPTGADPAKPIARSPDTPTVQGTFVAPGASVKLAPAKPVSWKTKSIKGVEFENKVNIHGLEARGGDCYFLVMTLQRGPAPEVKVEGEGLDAKVTVGGRTIRFDGQKIVIGQ